MSVQRYTSESGKVRYRARVKSHGREVATRVFDRKRDADAWEADQRLRLQRGDWFDPRRGRVALGIVAVEWQESRRTVKRNTQIADSVAWKQHIEPRFGALPVASITSADVSNWVGRLVAQGCKPSTASRYLAAFRSLLQYCVADGRVMLNVAASVRAPTAGHVRREGEFLTVDELDGLVDACTGKYAEVVRVLALTGLRWGELAGLQVGDRIRIPGHGLRLQRAILASGNKGDLFEDTLKNKRARTVPLIEDLVPVFDEWSLGKSSEDWLFGAPRGGPLGESNWKRSVAWAQGTKAIGMPRQR
jgi:integrase